MNYTFKNKKTGIELRLAFPASQYDTIVRDGCLVEAPDFERDLVADHSQFRHTYESGWPMVSSSLQVGVPHVDAARNAIKTYGGLGGVEVMNDGRVKFDNERSRSKYVTALRASGHSVRDAN